MSKSGCIGKPPCGRIVLNIELSNVWLVVDGHQGTGVVAKVANGHRRNQPESRRVTGKSQFLGGWAHHKMAGYLLHFFYFPGESWIIAGPGSGRGCPWFKCLLPANCPPSIRVTSRAEKLDTLLIWWIMAWAANGLGIARCFRRAGQQCLVGKTSYPRCLPYLGNWTAKLLFIEKIVPCCCLCELT